MNARTAAAYVARLGTTQGEPGQPLALRCSKATCGCMPAAATAASQLATSCGCDVAAS